MNIWGLVFISIFYFLEIKTYMTAIYWIYHLEKIKCECSNTFHKKYIKEWIKIYIFVTTIVYIYNLYSIFNSSNDSNISYVFQIPFTILSLVNVIVSIHYIDKLKQLNCTCSEHLARETYYIFSWLKLGLITFFAFILFIITLSIAYSIAMNKNTSWWFKIQKFHVKISNNNIPSFSIQNIERTKPKVFSVSLPKRQVNNK